MKITELKLRSEIGLVLNEMGLTGLGAEIGVAFGENAEFILDRSHLQRLILVDPWAYVPGEDPLGYGDVIKNWEGCLKHCVKRLSRFGNRTQYLRMGSIQAAATVPDKTLDFVYLDGNHMSPYVDRDIELWYPKVKPGGIFGGHDYMVLRNPDYHCDVKTAIDNFVEENCLTLHFADPVDSSWYLIVPDRKSTP